MTLERAKRILIEQGIDPRDYIDPSTGTIDDTIIEIAEEIAYENPHLYKY